MTTYTATFRTDAEFATRDFEADTAVHGKRKRGACSWPGSLGGRNLRRKGWKQRQSREQDATADTITKCGTSPMSKVC
jgi:hypothetical protein